MKHIIILFCYISYSSSQIASMNKASASLCDNPNAKNTRLEQIFNTIFAEFNTPPPACVCVQICIGEFTYCYPSGCLNRYTAITTPTEKEILPKPVVKTTTPQTQRSKSQFMLVKDDKYDFITDFLERNYLDELKATPKIDNPMEDLRPDPFKDKYNLLGKYRKSPIVELRYNLQEKVKNSKSDLIKVEGWVKPKWAKNKNKNTINKWFSDIPKPSKVHSAYFQTMLPDKEVVEYPPKYFKRDLKKVEDDDGNVLKAFYVLDSFNTTDSDSLSFETLINNLIDNSIVTSADNDTTKFPISKRDEYNETKVTIENDISENSTEYFNDTTRANLMNFTNEIVDKNKDAVDSFQINNTASVKEMILHLEKQIEIQNNTSMEIARRTLSNVTDDIFKINKDGDLVLNSSLYSSENSSSTIYNPTELENTTYTTNTEPETTTLQEVLVTKKNRQRLVKKYANIKAN